MCGWNIHGSVLHKSPKTRNNLKNLHQQNNKSCYIQPIKMNKLQQQARTWVTLTKKKKWTKANKIHTTFLCDSIHTESQRRAKLNSDAWHYAVVFQYTKRGERVILGGAYLHGFTVTIHWAGFGILPHRGPVLQCNSKFKMTSQMKSV